MKRGYQPTDPPRRLDPPVGGSGCVKVIDSWKTEMIDVLKSIRDELEKTRKVMEIIMKDDRIVRCKDCRWYGKDGCAIRIVDDTDKPEDDDFCSFAEIKF